MATPWLPPEAGGIPGSSRSEGPTGSKARWLLLAMSLALIVTTVANEGRGSDAHHLVQIGCALLWLSLVIVGGATGLRRAIVLRGTAVDNGVAAAPRPPGTTHTNGFAIASLVLGLVGGGLLAVVFGHIALHQMDRSGGSQGGRGMAIAGLILGYLGLAAGIVVFIFVWTATSNL